MTLNKLLRGKFIDLWANVSKCFRQEYHDEFWRCIAELDVFDELLIEYLKESIKNTETFLKYGEGTIPLRNMLAHDYKLLALLEGKSMEEQLKILQECVKNGHHQSKLFREELIPELEKSLGVLKCKREAEQG